MNQRDERQALIGEWVSRAFSPVLINPNDLLERSRRVLEEALELYQSVGGVRSTVDLLADRTFSRPRGSAEQELGQVGITLLAFANAAGLSADRQEQIEVFQALRLPASYFTCRMAKKMLSQLALYQPSEIDRASDFVKESSE